MYISAEVISSMVRKVKAKNPLEAGYKNSLACSLRLVSYMV
jgi:hypothetical protein